MIIDEAKTPNVMKKLLSFHSLLILLSFLCFQSSICQAQEIRCINPDSVINEAVKYIGVPYKWGGKTPNGFDCAGFTRYIYGKFGVSLAPSAAPQYKVGIKVKKNEIGRADLVFFGGRHSTKSIGHVGIVTSVEEDGSFKFIHASSTGIRITSSKESYYAKRYIGACRIIDRDEVAEAGLLEVPVDTVTPDTLYTIAMVGDMMLGTLYPKPMLPLDDGKHLFDDVRDILTAATIAVGNCEGVFCGDNIPCDKSSGAYSYAFRMPPSYSGLFKEAGFDFLSLANNHSEDFGTEGVKETMAILDSVGIRYAGVKSLCQTALIQRDSVTYGFCAFGHNSYTCRHQDTALALSIIRSLRDSCDILIVSFHGGAEGKDQTHLPQGTETFLGEDRGSLRSFAHLCIDNGADLVYGHGPHVCRAVEVYNGHFIAYSLGNFCTPTGISVSGISGYSPVITVRLNSDGMLVDGRIHSFIQPFRKGPRVDKKNIVAKAIRTLTMEDFENPHILIEDDGTFQPVE